MDESDFDEEGKLQDMEMNNFYDKNYYFCLEIIKSFLTHKIIMFQL